VKHFFIFYYTLKNEWIQKGEMREKVERESSARARGAIRLTEFDSERRGGFVNRLDQETTSFFFTNFPEDVKVVELWSIFAKHGRVGEVYIPKKRDKRGNRFGFVKFKEVKCVEALSSRLEDTWVGTYKIRINVSRFGRKSSSVPEEQERIPSTLGVPEDAVRIPMPFKQALLNGGRNQSKAGVPTVEVEVVTDFLKTLEGSFVGWLGNGVEVRALQTKLWLAGFSKVLVVAMGGDLALISHSNGEELHGPFCKKDWWGGLLFDLKRWTPNLVCSKREMWVNMFGVPLHAWGEHSFRALANRCGAFLSLDAGTSKRSRLDVARVKIEVPLGSRIDHTYKLMVHGAAYWVKVVVEGGRSLVVGEGEVVEEQLGNREYGSVCGSGRNVVARTVLEGLDGGDTKSEASFGGHYEVPVGVQVVNKSMGGKEDLGVGGDVSVTCLGVDVVIPSTELQVKRTGDQLSQSTFVHIRGSKSLVDVHIESQGVVGPELAEPILDNPSVVIPHVGGQMGSGSGQEGRPGFCVGPDPAGSLGLVLGSDPILSTKETGHVENIQRVNPAGGPIILALDNLIHEARGDPDGVVIFSDLSESSSDDSSTQDPLCIEEEKSQTKLKHQKHRRAKIPFPSILGPRCLSFAEAINKNSFLMNRKRNGGVQNYVPMDSTLKPVNQQNSCFGQDGGDVNQVEDRESDAADVVPCTPTEVVESQTSKGIQLEVVLPIHPPSHSQSGVELLLREDNVQDVEGFFAARATPEAKRLEAQKLLSLQNEVGFSFKQHEESTIEKLIELEDRDREEFVKNQGSNGNQ
jgi:hypothetical protein